MFWQIQHTFNVGTEILQGEQSQLKKYEGKLNIKKRDMIHNTGFAYSHLTTQYRQMFF